MEGGHTKPDKTEFTECWRTTWKTPYIMRLALSAGIGGLLFGYDTGRSSSCLDFISICYALQLIKVDKGKFEPDRDDWQFAMALLFYQILFRGRDSGIVPITEFCQKTCE